MSTGWTGPQGSQGSQGPAGTTGPTGQQGFQGTPGYNGLPYGIVPLITATSQTLTSGYLSTMTVIQNTSAGNITITLPTTTVTGSWIYIIWCNSNAGGSITFTDGTISVGPTYSRIGPYNAVYSSADGCWNQRITTCTFTQVVT